MTHVAQADKPKTTEVIEPVKTPASPLTPQKPTPKKGQNKHSSPFISAEKPLDAESYNDEEQFEPPRVRTLVKPKTRTDLNDVAEKNILEGKRLRRPPKQKGEGRNNKQTGGWSSHI